MEDSHESQKESGEESEQEYERSGDEQFSLDL